MNGAIEIVPISQKEAKQIEHDRKTRNLHGVLIFQASNGRWYKCNHSGIRGVEAITKFKKKIDKQIQDQLELL